MEKKGDRQKIDFSNWRYKYMQLGSLGRKLSGSSLNMMSFVYISVRIPPVMEQG